MITQIKDMITQIKGVIMHIQDEQNRKILIIGISSVVLLAVDVFFVFIPLVNKSFDLKTQIISIKNNTASLDRQIAMLDNTRKRSEVLKAEQTRYKEFFPKEEEVPAILGDLSSIAGKLGVDIIAVKPVKLNSQQNTEKIANLFHEVPIEISAKGGYHHIAKFINKLETLDKFIEVKDLEIVANQTTPRRHFFRLLVSMYISRT